MTLKTINTEIVTPEMDDIFTLGSKDYAWHDGPQVTTHYVQRVARAILEAAPVVEGEPFCYVNENARHILENGRRVHADKSNEDGWFNVPLYLHPQPTLAEKIERIRALKLKEPVIAEERHINYLIDHFIAILEDKA